MKKIIKNPYLFCNLFLIIGILICLMGFIFPIKDLIKSSIGLTLVMFAVLFLVIIFIKFIFNKINLENKKTEIISVFVIILLAILLRFTANIIMRTEPISDFNTPHAVYQLKDTIFTHKDTTEELSSYQLYYSRYPAWFTYMKVVEVIYDIFGYNIELIKYFNLFLVVLTIALTYIAVKNIFNKKVALLSIMLFAFYPSLIIYANITTPDIITIFLFSCYLLDWSLIIKSKKWTRKYYLLLLLNIVILLLINLFKPLSVYGLLVFVCAFLLYTFLPSIVDTSKRIDFKKNIVLFVSFCLIFIISLKLSNQLLNIAVEKEIKTDVVDSTSLYMLWAYSVDDNKNYNPNIATKTFEDLLGKYKYNQKLVMNDINKLAKKQFLNNIKYLPKILYQKSKIVFSSERDIFLFANSTKDKKHDTNVYDKYYGYYKFLANAYSSLLYLFVCITFLFDIKSKNKNLYKIVIALMVVGYLLMLLLGGVQSRYKTIISVPICILASTAILRKKDEKC